MGIAGSSAWDVSPQAACILVTPDMSSRGMGRGPPTKERIDKVVRGVQPSGSDVVRLVCIMASHRQLPNLKFLSCCVTRCNKVSDFEPSTERRTSGCMPLKAT
jgi:hypothetical protein